MAATPVGPGSGAALAVVVVEAKQPAHYKLSPQVKAAAGGADWPLILDAARGAIDVHREEGFSLIAGITALICGGA